MKAKEKSLFTLQKKFLTNPLTPSFACFPWPTWITNISTLHSNLKG